MSVDTQKRAAAEAAVERIEPGSVIGVGSGSTVDQFIDALAASDTRIEAAVAASEASAERLRNHGIEVRDANSVSELSIYVDGADEISRHLQMIKGGGGALTREKVIAAIARRFVCIVDESKWVRALGDFPLPVEVVPMARSYVGRQLLKHGGRPTLREGFTTDNGNVILDVQGLDCAEPIALERALNNIAGVVTNGLFAARPADELLVGTDTGVQRFTAA
ncbi:MULTISPECIES: ribose-5-phosphate isomerase RpiA [Spiribacter]|jgi:ribose 5-phosphate isomerase A|uniref:Ribose-5-phosphate isomerase A n=1 Tax=Spiribacter aquaticus TaxID=1935996 RepID=A0A557RM29_9GAMM|nr:MULTISPECIES: ribose-5-phosphate isomerase RpiA [Spiribacter]PYZ99553.1 ribose-5-phosphate isomerase RpiA [Gammaproteobacteria bacterium 2W06]AUB79473.1 ribose 5-phosphate isomerase A [Spiribacter roseus]KAF0279272.1 ribose 5-phosphate isomerase A [Spiribacter roseus]KAF0284695.1 ribose 5-phosphate isomerase A [Spiribacter roseus]TVO66231.1 ribose-5-phosphate isomerase RpiA [Spiribacter aquaticus]